MTKTIFSVQMNCKNCIGGVTDALNDNLEKEVTSVDCNLETQQVTVEHTCAADKVLEELCNWAEDVEHKVCLFPCDRSTFVFEKVI